MYIARPNLLAGRSLVVLQTRNIHVQVCAVIDERCFFMVIVALLNGLYFVYENSVLRILH